MKPALCYCSPVLAAFLFVCGCRSSHPGTPPPPVIPTVELTGTSNAPITGYFVENDRRFELSGVLPMTIERRGLSQLAVRKLNSEDTLVLTARSQNGSATQTVRPRLDEGVRVLLDNLSLSSIPPQESLAPPTEDEVVLTPYFYEGAWVFDDPERNLEHEPFVAGMPDIIEALVKNIPDARDGFRLTLSAKVIPGYQHKLEWMRAEGGGNLYRLEGTQKEGWLGPVMFRYFSRAPKVLYTKAASKRS